MGGRRGERRRRGGVEEGGEGGVKRGGRRELGGKIEVMGKEQESER